MEQKAGTNPFILFLFLARNANYLFKLNEFLLKLSEI